MAFLRHVRSDDAHDFGRISELRRSLEGEVKIQTSHSFHIFQDRNDISWGEQWKERIESALRGVTFLIPIVTPSYFQSPACRSEFHTFLIRERERELGEERLILPIYYVSCDEMDSDLEWAERDCHGVESTKLGRLAGFSIYRTHVSAITRANRFASKSHKIYHKGT